MLIYVCSRKKWHKPVDAAGCHFPNCGGAAMQETVPDDAVAVQTGESHINDAVPKTTETPVRPDEPDTTLKTDTIPDTEKLRDKSALPPKKPSFDIADYRKFLVPAIILLIVIAGIGGNALWPRRPLHADATPMPAKDFLLKQVTPAAIKAEGDRRWKAGAHDDAVLLLEEAARRGSGPADSELASLYDPTETLDASARLPPDARASARYYSDAAKLGVDVTGKRARLRASLAAKAEAGDTLARLTLKDFWP